MIPILRLLATHVRPSFSECLEMDVGLFNALVEHLPRVEDGADLRYIASVLGKPAG